MIQHAISLPAQFKVLKTLQRVLSLQNAMRTQFPALLGKSITNVSVSIGMEL